MINLAMSGRYFIKIIILICCLGGVGMYVKERFTVSRVV